LGDFLHWIGRQYYKQREFTTEAKREGVTRRIALTMLKAMNWRDRVYLIGRRDGRTKSGRIFGYFDLRRIVGMPKEVTEALMDQGLAYCTDLGGKKVERACGEYLEGPSFVVDATIGEICSILEGLTEQLEEKPKLMVGGKFVAIDPAIRMPDIPFQQGFRKFDGCAFDKARKEARKPVLKGMFYPPVDEVRKQDIETGALTTLETYSRR